MTSVIYQTLYHLDSNNNLRVWSMERDGARFKTHAGIQNGAIVSSEWKTAEAKNVGRSNATTPEEQADLEVRALYQKRLDRKYATEASNAQRSNFLAPMLAATYDPKKTKLLSTVYTQPKLDGIRCLLNSTGGTSRSGKPFFTVGHIVDEVAEFCDLYNITLDGELYNHALKDDFEKLVSLIKQQKIEKLTSEELAEIREKVKLYVYDVILHDYPEMGFKDRMNFLREAAAEHGIDIIFVETLVWENDTLPANIDEQHGKYIEQGYEGLMIRIDMAYEHKRSKGLYKHKDFMEEEFTLIDIIEGEGNWAGAAKSVIVRVPNGETSDGGILGSHEKNAKLLAEKADYIGGDVTMKFQGYTKAGKLRFGVAKLFHKGKRDI